MKQNKPFIHKDAVVESRNIGGGTRIWRNVHVMPGAVIGNDCNIGEGCYIENYVRIGNGVTIKNNIAIWDNITIEDDVFIGPAAVFTNDLRPRAFNKKRPEDFMSTLMKRGATIGANATIVCGITIHEYALIGAGSVVTRDVPSYHVVYGNPARFKGLICSCSEMIPAGKKRFHCKCGLKYEIRGRVVTKVS
ncbi:MAG: acyltransferase [Nitrospirae bacterium]|nr:acyltransferase [Nitrospirota bacterium]